MPVTRYRRRRRNYPVRRTAKRKLPMKRMRKKYQRVSSKILKCPTAFPDKMRVKLSFGTAIAVTTIGGAVTQQYRVMACASPLSSTGYSSALQPQGFDQWASMYFNYRPLAMAVKHTFGITNEVTGIQCVYMRGYWSNTSSGFANDAAVIQNRYTKTRYINADSNFQTIKSYSNLHTILGDSRYQWYNDDNSSALVTANPVNLVSYFLHITTITGSIVLNGQLETQGDLWVEFFNPRPLLDA